VIRARAAALTLVASLVVLSAPSPARAAPGDGELQVNRTVDGSFVVAGGVLWMLSESLLKRDLAPESCRWCDGDSLNAVDRGVRDALRWDDTHSAQTISNVSGFVVVPVTGLGLLALAGWQDERSRGEIFDDELVVMESVVGAVLLNQGVKFIAGRERPFVRALPAGEKGDDADNNVSFYSGHTSLTFSIAVASGTVASLRGYRAAPWIWASGLTLATATGYLRIAGDKHYFTDVLTGAVLGSFVGFAVPYWLHRRSDGDSEAGRAGALGAGWSAGPVVSWSGTF
jgi:membrane-associated phospholipid phosphatase